MEQRLRARARRIASIAIAALFAASIAPAAGSDAVLYRIFLRDGATLISYGEFARVAGRVVFSIPLGDVARTPHLELVSVPEASVDWDRTDRYAEAARAIEPLCMLWCIPGFLRNDWAHAFKLLT